MKKRARTIIRVAIASGLLAAMGLLAACGSTQPTTPVDAAPAPSGQSKAPAVTPTIKLVVPAAGSTVPAGTVKVKVESTDLAYTMPSNTNVPGEGHVHFTLDDRPFEMSTEPEFEFKDVEPGTHKLVAELVQNNTDSFDPPVEVEIEFVAE